MHGVKFTIDAKKFKKDFERIDQRMRFAGEGAEHALAVQMAKDTDPMCPPEQNPLRTA